MKAHACCDHSAANSQPDAKANCQSSGRRGTIRQRLISSAGCLVSGLALAAVPKCPACVAAYVALATGCGISLAAASAARWLLAITCIAALAYFVFHAVRPRRSRS